MESGLRFVLLSGFCVCLCIGTPISITYNQQGKPIEPLRYGFNDVLGPIVNLSFSDPSLTKLASTLRIGGLRHPGGTVANYWNWTAGDYVTCNSSVPKCGKYDRRNKRIPKGVFTPSNWNRGIAKHIVGTVFDLNVLTLSVRQALDALNTLAASGNNVTHLELGNEFYFPKTYGWRFPNSKVYMREMKQVIKHARRLFPAAKIAAVARGPTPHQPNWDPDMQPYSDLFDAVTQHDYSCSQPDIQHLPYGDQLSYVMGYSQAMVDRIGAYFASTFPSHEIWQTEFNWAIREPPFGPHAEHTGIHAGFHLARMLAVHEYDNWKVLFLHTLATQRRVSEFTVALVPELADEPDAIRISGDAQVFAHLSHIALNKAATVTWHKANISNCPTLGVSVLNTTLECLQVGVFEQQYMANNNTVLHYIIINRCNQNLTATLDATATLSSQVIDLMTTVYYATDPGGFAPFPKNTTQFPWPAPLKPVVSQVANVTTTNPKVSLEALSFNFIQISPSSSF